LSELIDGAKTGRDRRPRVVVVGGGFAGLHAAKALAHLPVDVTVVDRRNHHIFQPLLYQVALAVLSPADIAQPIRGVLRGQKNTEVLMDEVVGIDVKARRLSLGSGASLNYDYLAIGSGATHSYFGHDAWAPLAPGLRLRAALRSVRQSGRTRRTHCWRSAPLQSPTKHSPRQPAQTLLSCSCYRRGRS